MFVNNYHFFKNIKEMHTTLKLDIIGWKNIRITTADKKLLKKIKKMMLIFG